MSVFTVVTATASTFFNGATTAAMAFDGDDTTIWHSTADMPCWIQGQMGSAVVANFCSIQIYTVSASRSPRDFTIQGSNNGSTWTTLDTRTSVTWTLDEFKTFNFANATAYSYYRVSITANNGDNYENMRRVDFGDSTLPATSKLTESYVESLTIPTSSPRNLIESYVESLTIPTATPRNLVESYVEGLVAAPPVPAFPRNPRISALTGNVLWLRAKDARGLNGDTFTTWPDQSGLAHDGIGVQTVSTASTPLGGSAIQFGQSGATPFTLPVLSNVLASASSFVAGTWLPSYAFDGVQGGSGNSWASFNSTMPQWLQAQVNTAQVATGYTLKMRTDVNNQAPTAWTFLGSNDGSAWTTLDTQIGQTLAQSSSTTFSFSNSTTYTYYRINITAMQAGSNVAISELAITGVATATTTAAEIWVVLNAGASTNQSHWQFGGSGSGSNYPFSDGKIYEDFGSVTRNSWTPTMSINAWRIYRVANNGTTFQAWLDGVSQFTAAGQAFGWKSAPTLGSAVSGINWTGKMAEVLVRSQVSTTLEAGDITNYLRAEHLAVPQYSGWGIPL